MSERNEKELPVGWVWATLNDCVEMFQYGSSAKTQDADGVPILRMGNVQTDGRLDLSNLKFLPSTHDEFPSLLLQSGDLLFNRTNSAELVGKTGVYRGHPSPCSFASYLIRIKVSEGIRPDLVAACLNSGIGRRWIKAVVNQTVGQANVNGTKLSQFRFPLPPLAEQTRIADKLDELLSDLDAGVAALERVRAKLKHYRAAVLKAAVEGSLTADWRAQHPATESASDLLTRILAERRRRWEAAQLQKFKDQDKSPPKDWKAKYQEPTAPDVTKLPQLPKGWCWATPSQLGDVQLGRQRAPQHHSGAFMRPYLRVANVYEGRIDLGSVYEMNFTPEEFDTFALRSGDILLNEGQSLELVGRSAIYRDELPGACFTNTLVRFRPASGLLAEYAQTYFCACLRSHRFRKLARWTTNIAHLGADRFAGMEVPLPPFAEQQVIVEAVEAQLTVIDHLEADLEAKLKSAQALRQSILRDAFEGKLVPQDPNDEPARELLKRIAAEREERAKAVKAVKSKGQLPRSPKKPATSLSKKVNSGHK